MTSTELVGPVRRILIGNDHGDWTWDQGLTRPPYRVPVLAPRNSSAPEAVACRNHHAACACFMAEVVETTAEHRWERDEIERVFDEVLAGHPTWALDEATQCMCSGCQIARAMPMHLRGLNRQRVEANTARLRAWQAAARAGRLGLVGLL